MLKKEKKGIILYCTEKEIDTLNNVTWVTPTRLGSLYYKHCIYYWFVCFTLSSKFLLAFKNKIGGRSSVTAEYTFTINKRVGNKVNKNGQQCIVS